MLAKRYNDQFIEHIHSSTYKSNVVVKKVKNFQIDKNDKNRSLLQKINESDHIVEFISVKDENQLFLIMTFANDGNLRNYIKINTLSFNKKIEIATSITNGIIFLHENNIIYENLIPKNILIFDGIVKISSLPLLHNDKESYFDEDFFNNIGYIDPNSLLNRNYKKDKSVDIYSLGTLLWEIMSENVPYSKDQKNINITQLMGKIKGGYREDDVANIPVEYIKLYKKCWDGDSSKRPSINSVSDELLNMKKLGN